MDENNAMSVDITMGDERVIHKGKAVMCLVIHDKYVRCIIGGDIYEEEGTNAILELLKNYIKALPENRQKSCLIMFHFGLNALMREF